jgi:hypothetical protein
LGGVRVFWVVIEFNGEAHRPETGRYGRYQYLKQPTIKTLKEAIGWANTGWSGKSLAVYDEYGTCHYARFL